MQGRKPKEEIQQTAFLHDYVKFRTPCETTRGSQRILHAKQPLRMISRDEWLGFTFLEKSYLQTTSQRLARGKLVNLHGRRSLALPSVGPASARILLPSQNIQRILLRKNIQRVGAHIGSLRTISQRKWCLQIQTLKRAANNFATTCYLHRAAKLASNLRFSAFQLVASLYKNAAKFSQQNADFATLWSDLLAMAVTPSFQLRIAHRLKHWILDFLSFEMLCMPYWIRNIKERLVKIETPRETELEVCLNIMDVPPEDQNSQHGQEDNFNAYRSMRDRMHPPRMSAPSCIVPPTEQLVIRPHIVPLLPTFHGMESENPYSHIKEFEEDKAKIWLNSLRPRKNEKFYECWERYMEAINVCPHDGFDTWLLVSYFYNVSRGWDEPNAREVGRMKSQPNAKGGMYVLNEDIDMKAKVVAMARRLEELEMKKIQKSMPCSICQSYKHLMREMFGDEANVIDQFKPNNNASYGNTYNSNWRNHPNFSWKPKPPQYTQPTQAP
ncbi:hypothetical protein AAG906_038537 [Vitis piasezkii]